jgi:hypothetical protein
LRCNRTIRHLSPIYQRQTQHKTPGTLPITACHKLLNGLAGNAARRTINAAQMPKKTVSPEATLDSADETVPLSLKRRHLHVRLCVHNHSATSDSRNPQQQNIQKLLTP